MIIILHKYLQTSILPNRTARKSYVGLLSVRNENWVMKMSDSFLKHAFNNNYYSEMASKLLYLF